jgi:hypothetical protein
MTLAALLTLLSACGGGAGDQVAGVSSGGTGSVGVGSGKPTAVLGQVSAQGLVVNDVTIDVNASTTIEDLDGHTLSASALQVGTTVAVDGDTTTARSDGMHSKALRIQVRGLLLGTVQSVNLAQGSLQLMDQTVVLATGGAVDARWPQGLRSIQVGDTVEVFGWQDLAMRRYVATRLGSQPSGQSLRVTGMLAKLDLQLGQCEVGTQAISYGWPQATPTLGNGQWVRGELYNMPPDATTGRWLAVGMATVAPWVQDKAQVSLDGLLTQVGPGGLKLDVQGWPVQAQAATCAICAGLQVGDHVRVLGSLVQGTVQAIAITTLPSP